MLQKRFALAFEAQFCAARSSVYAAGDIGFAAPFTPGGGPRGGPPVATPGGGPPGPGSARKALQRSGAIDGRCSAAAATTSARALIRGIAAGVFESPLRRVPRNPCH